jgi:hypothetical protein
MKLWRFISTRGFLLPGLVLAAVLITSALLSLTAGRGKSAPLPVVYNPAMAKQIGLPQYGWEVCADLGFGSVPGVTGAVQRMAICHGDGWVVQAYCLEPQKPVPALNVPCSMINTTDFWCGDSAQLLREYQLQQTAAPSSTPLPSSTPVPSATPLPSATATVQATLAPTITNTLPQGEETPQGGGGESPTMQATVFVRPHAGGGSTMGPALSALAAALGLGLIAAALLLNRRG